MKIGILTYHWVSNFGANLQTLSTYKKIEKEGHTPIIINWIPDDLKIIYETRVSKEQNEIHCYFANKYYKNITELCKDKYDIAKAIDKHDIDLVIIGSDAVFSYTPILSRIRICRYGLWYFKPISDFDCPNPFWGDFYELVKHPIKLVAMSASAQNTPFKKIKLGFERERFTKAISRFSYISVRDIWTRMMLSYVQKVHVDYPITPDPVFSFEQNVQPVNDKNVAERHTGIKGKYSIFSVTKSVTNKEWILQLEKLFAQQGITLIGLPQTNFKHTPILKHNMPFPLDPMDWYNFIKNSCGYIGELMHPILVSLHNAVPVFPLDLYGFKEGGCFNTNSSKTYQIIKRFGLLDSYYNIKDEKPLQDPEFVFNCIMNFDYKRCREISKELQDSYEEMMKHIFAL